AAGRARRGFRVHRDAGRGRGRDRGVQNGRAARDRRAHSRPRRHAPRRPRVPGAPRVPGQGERASAGPVARHRRPAWRHREGSPGVGGPVRDVAQAHARAEHADRRALGAARRPGRSRLRPAARERRRPGPARQRSPDGDDGEVATGRCGEGAHAADRGLELGRRGVRAAALDPRAAGIRWWAGAYAAWSQWKPSGIAWAHALRAEVEKYPYLLSVNIRASADHDDGQLAGGYFLLLEHLENESPTLIRTALDRAIESAQGLEPRVL